MDEQLREGLRRLVILYSRTKRFILQAEETDRESRANIAIFKEQRDALDHIMRALNRAFNDPPDHSNAEYVEAQFDKAWGHLFRAAYDSLDGVDVSFKLRLEEAMRGVSNDAISAVYPEYYTKVHPEMFELQKQIAEFRSTKDVHKSTFEDLDAYCGSVERLAELTKQILTRVPAFKDWQKRDRVSVWVRNFAIPVVVGSVVFLVTKGCQGESHVAQSPEKPSASATPGPAKSK
jgi:hypothetical protein